MAKTKVAQGDCARGPRVGISKTPYADFYTGTQEALTAAGICKAEWFPSELEKDERFCPPRTKRTYAVAARDPAITLTHRLDSEGRPYWVARFDVPEAERAARQREKEREDESYGPPSALPWSDREATGRDVAHAPIALAPPVAPGSLTQAELYHLRLLRTLSEDGRDFVLDFVERVAMGEASKRATHPKSAARSSLRVVVDNSRHE